MEISKKKSKIIPNELKYNIDEILESQLFNANRYYAESNANISDLMRKEMIKKPTEFLKELKERWNWHNVFYEDLLEKSFLEIFDNSIQNFSPKQINDLIEIYKTCCLVDEATLVTSGAIKKHLEYQLPYISVSSDGIEDSDARFMLLTPPVETFFAQYQIDHLSYIIMLKHDAKKAEKFKKYLLNKYHANDEEIFKGRFAKKFSNKMNCSEEELIKYIERYKISDEYKIKHLYFTLEHPQRKAFRDLIIYDNVDEKFISSQLIGISGFLFRRKILEYLNEAGVLINDGYIYEFPKEVVIEALNKLLNERKFLMEKDIKPYKQKGMTCAIACMLMVLEYYKIIPKADYLYEKKYYRAYHSKYMDGTPFSALAWHFAKNDLDTEIIHSEINTFNNADNYLDDFIFNNSMKEYLEFLENAKNKGAKISNGFNLNCETIKQKLEDGKMVILAGQHGVCLHAILICGYHDNNFVICDPLFKEKQLKTKEEINDFMNTPLGKWCVVVGSKTKNKDILLKSIPKYQEEAKVKLNKIEQKDLEDNFPKRKIKK